MIDVNRIEFFLERIDLPDCHSFSSSINQLFKYLESESTDKSIYRRYEQDRERWKDWPGGDEGGSKVGWVMPNDFEESKSLAYHVYKSAGEQNDDGSGLSYILFKKNDLDESINQFNWSFMNYFKEALNDILKVEPDMENTKNAEKTFGRKVFIVHGHDENMKIKVQLLLKNADLEDVVLHEQSDRGRNIIDKLIQEGENACYVIALLSPDDEITDGQKRARQNVVLEIGYFLGKLGKDRVRMLVKGDIDIPSDLHGVLYEKYDQEGNWRSKLLKEIQAVGIEIDYAGAISRL